MNGVPVRCAAWAGVLLTLTLVLGGCGSKIEVVSALPEAEGNEVLAALLNAGVPANKVPGKGGLVSVAVDEARLARAIDLLREQGLPRPRQSRMGEVFRKDNLLSSPMEERARYMFALSQEMERTLCQIDGVVTARVHIVIPEKSTMGEKATPSAAAVFIKYQAGYGVEGLEALIKSVVANSVTGLTEDLVSVAMVPSRAGHAGSASPAAIAADDAGLRKVWMFKVDASSEWPLRVLLIVLGLVALGGILHVLSALRSTARDSSPRYDLKARLVGWRHKLQHRIKTMNAGSADGS
ncbi:MAG: type III secretion inner membrane ring lipoprotein SctJ [Burkholderiaceae bacterium]|nr:type III secretion inner membrane ring lipoprotein SctJ [Burkholderiaceae bacterium]